MDILITFRRSLTPELVGGLTPPRHAALDRLEPTVKVRPGDGPRLLGLIHGARDAVRAVADRTT